MRGRGLRRGSLTALVCALTLVVGVGSALAGSRPREVKSESPEKGILKRWPPSKVTVRFYNGELGPEKDVTIEVRDRCERLLGKGTQPGPDEEATGPHVVSIPLDKQEKNPRGRYAVSVTYWPAPEEPEEDGSDPGETPPADEEEETAEEESKTTAEEESKTYEYGFRVRRGPSCDPPGDGNNNHKKKTRVWGTTGGSGQRGDGNENMRTASPTTDSTTDHTSTDFGSYTSPTLSGDDYANTGSSMTPFGEDDFGEPFGDTTGTSPLSDPTDPSLYDSEVGQVPEEAEDQTLSAARADDLEPEPSTLVVALATALLLGVGGGLFLRRTDPAPIRARS
ncbi:MAG: hypothetical protein GEU68_05115 [Actinobacteria bacterium]|nr:hypothetical protein [Actinomycetota bacterium]